MVGALGLSVLALLVPCKTSDLAVSTPGGRFIFNGATGSLVGGAVFRNRTQRSCILDGWPSVRFVGGGSADVVQIQSRLTPSEPRLHVLRPGRRGWFWVIWSNWCGPGSKGASGPYAPPRAVRIGLPRAGGRIELLVAEAPRCDVAGKPSRVGVEAFTPRS